MCIHFDQTVAFWGLRLREMRARGPRNLLPGCLLGHYLCWLNTWEPSACLSVEEERGQLWSIQPRTLCCWLRRPSLCAYCSRYFVSKASSRFMRGARSDEKPKPKPGYNNPPSYVSVCFYEQRKKYRTIPTSRLMLISSVYWRGWEDGQER